MGALQKLHECVFSGQKPLDVEMLLVKVLLSQDTSSFSALHFSISYSASMLAFTLIDGAFMNQLLGNVELDQAF
jgi:hypothetical protein